MAKASEQVGLWLVGACGGVGTTATLGIEAIRRKLAAPAGLIGHLAPFDKLGLLPLENWVIGGHEIRATTFEATARELHEHSGVFSRELLAACRPWLRQCDRQLRTGTASNCGAAIAGLADRPGALARKSAAEWVEQLAGDIRGFRRRNRLARVVVVNVASTEPPFGLARVHGTWKSLSAGLARKSAAVLPASSLYALAAIEAGAGYINFTPSPGIDVPALRCRADESGTAYMGSDGKTGETLMKSVLAPMFAARNLRVLSWVGHNIFGNRDALVLDDPSNKRSKAASKDRLIREILGYAPKTLVSIENVPSLGDWKTAWDHIHFEGFLGTRMALQFTWQGCDSVLAAPLVIELARFAELAMRRGESGPMPHLSCFFKSPLTGGDQAFGRQYEALLAYVAGTTRSC